MTPENTTINPPPSRQSIARYAIDTIGLVFDYKTLMFKINKLKKLINISLFLKVFARSICTGFENKMEQLTADPTKLESAPKDISALQKIQDKIQEAILTKETDNSFIQSFKSAFDEQMAKIKKADANSQSVLNGNDFIYAITENPGAIERRFRAISSQSIPGIREAFDTIYATLSATYSAIFIDIDHAGKSIGEKLSELTISGFHYIAPTQYNNSYYALYVEKFVLGCLYLFTESTSIYNDYYQGLNNMIYDTLWYPVISGIMIGMGENLANTFPEAMPKFKEEIDKTEKTGGDLITQTKNMITNSIKQARNDFEKYDQPYENGGIQAALIKNAPASKKFLEGRSKILSLFNSSSFAQNYLKPGLLTIRALPLAIQAFASCTLFNTAKWVTKTLAEDPFTDCSIDPNADDPYLTII